MVNQEQLVTKKHMKVFLGGTCNGSKWRDKLIPLLEIDYYNPVVVDWTPERKFEEIRQRVECDYVLYVITPKMTGCYSIAELIDDSHKRPHRVYFCLLDEDEGLHFTEHQKKSLEAVKDLSKNNDVVICDSLELVAKSLNLYVPEKLKDGQIKTLRLHNEILDENHTIVYNYAYVSVFITKDPKSNVPYPHILAIEMAIEQQKTELDINGTHYSWEIV